MVAAKITNLDFTLSHVKVTLPTRQRRDNHWDDTRGAGSQMAGACPQKLDYRKTSIVAGFSCNA
jgi:hypothetical protein